MTTKNKTYMIIGIIVAVVAIIIIIVIASNDNNQIAPLDEYKEQNENPTDTLPVGKFPLIAGDKNQLVKNMQTALIKMGCNISAGATGYYGAQTKTALKCAGYNELKIIEPDYNDIIAGKKKVVLKNGEKIVATVSGGPIYDYNDRSKILLYTSAGTSHGYLIKTVGINFLGLGDSASGYPKYYVERKYFI